MTVKDKYADAYNAKAEGIDVYTTTDSTFTVLSNTHNKKTIVGNNAAGQAFTLPAAVLGEKFKIVVGTTITSNSTTIKAANASDSFVGFAYGVDTDAEGATGYTWNADSGDDTFTMTGTTNGGVVGDHVEIECVAANTFLVKGYITQSGGSEVTPFSATVS